MKVFPDTIPNADACVWATMIPYRSPEFKVHKSESLANSALGNRSANESWAKYQLVNGSWVKVLEYKPEKRCDRCNNFFSGFGAYDSGRNRQTYFYSGPKYLAPVLCRSCWDSDYKAHMAKSREKEERAQLARLKAKYNN